MDGMSEVLANVAKFNRDVSDALEIAATAGANEALMHIKEGTPEKSGRLKKSYDKRVEDKTEDMVNMRIGTDVPYAARQEFGFFGADSLGRVYNQKGTPHVRPGVYNHEDEIFVAVESAFKTILGLE